MKKETKKLIIIFVIILIILSVWLILSAIYKCEFWGIAFKDWISVVLTIIIGIVFAYLLNKKNSDDNKKNSDERLFLNAFIEKLTILISLLDSCEKTITYDYSKETFRSEMLSKNRIINNYIDSLSKHAIKFDSKEDFDFLKVEYAELKIITTDYLDSLNDQKNRIKARDKIDLMIGKINDIQLKILNPDIKKFN